MRESLINEHGRGQIHEDPSMDFCAIDEKGNLLFLSSVVLDQLDLIYCDRGANDGIPFSDYF